MSCQVRTANHAGEKLKSSTSYLEKLSCSFDFLKVEASPACQNQALFGAYRKLSAPFMCKAKALLVSLKARKCFYDLSHKGFMTEIKPVLGEIKYHQNTVIT